MLSNYFRRGAVSLLRGLILPRFPAPVHRRSRRSLLAPSSLDYVRYFGGAPGTLAGSVDGLRSGWAVSNYHLDVVPNDARDLNLLLKDIFVGIFPPEVGIINDSNDDGSILGKIAFNDEVTREDLLRMLMRGESMNCFREYFEAQNISTISNGWLDLFAGLANSIRKNGIPGDISREIKGFRGIDLIGPFGGLSGAGKTLSPIFSALLRAERRPRIIINTDAFMREEPEIYEELQSLFGVEIYHLNDLLDGIGDPHDFPRELWVNHSIEVINRSYSEGSKLREVLPRLSPGETLAFNVGDKSAYQLKALLGLLARDLGAYGKNYNPFGGVVGALPEGKVGGDWANPDQEALNGQVQNGLRTRKTLATLGCWPLDKILEDSYVPKNNLEVRYLHDFELPITPGGKLDRFTLSRLVKNIEAGNKELGGWAGGFTLKFVDTLSRFVDFCDESKDSGHDMVDKFFAAHSADDCLDVLYMSYVGLVFLDKKSANIVKELIINAAQRLDINYDRQDCDKDCRKMQDIIGESFPETWSPYFCMNQKLGRVILGIHLRDMLGKEGDIHARVNAESKPMFSIDGSISSAVLSLVQERAPNAELSPDEGDTLVKLGGLGYSVRDRINTDNPVNDWMNIMGPNIEKLRAKSLDKKGHQVGGFVVRAPLR